MNMSLSAKEIKLDTELRKLISEFMDSDKDEPVDVISHIMDNRDELKVLVAAELDEDDLRELEEADDDEEAMMDLGLRLIEDEDHMQWIPAFTSEESFMKGNKEDDEDDEDDTTVPLNLFELMKQVSDSDDLEGIVIDPWGTSFPLPKEVLEDLVEDEEDAEGGISLVNGDIEAIRCDAVVNCSNNTLAPGKGGVNAAVYKAAGEGLESECRSLKGCKTGEAKITDSYELPCKYIIHTVGPIYSGRSSDEEELASCYDNSLYLAREHGLHSVAFPCISTGNFGYPKEDAMDIAVQTVLEWLADNDDYRMDVTFCCHGDADYKMYQDYLNDELGEPEE